MALPIDEIGKEFKFRTSKSSGSGGQHVNKTESKVELVFDVMHSVALTDEQKNILSSRLEKDLIDGVLHVVSSEDRSQIKNKEIAIKKLFQKLEKALKPVKKRKKTKPTKAALEKKRVGKTKRSEIKSLRRKPSY